MTGRERFRYTKFCHSERSRGISSAKPPISGRQGESCAQDDRVFCHSERSRGISSAKPPISGRQGESCAQDDRVFCHSERSRGISSAKLPISGRQSGNYTRDDRAGAALRMTGQFCHSNVSVMLTCLLLRRFRYADVLIIATLPLYNVLSFRAKPRNLVRKENPCP